MKPTIGRIVHYQLSETDCHEIDGRSPQYRQFTHEGGTGSVYMRNPVHPGQVYPAQVVASFGNGEHVNLIVQLDGYGTYWATSRGEGDQPGFWSWPPRA